MTFVISFLSMKNYPMPKAASASCFITTIIAVLLGRIIGLNPVFISVMIVLTVATTIWSGFERQPGAAI